MLGFNPLSSSARRAVQLDHQQPLGSNLLAPSVVLAAISSHIRVCTSMFTQPVYVPVLLQAKLSNLISSSFSALSIVLAATFLLQRHAHHFPHMPHILVLLQAKLSNFISSKVSTFPAIQAAILSEGWR